MTFTVVLLDSYALMSGSVAVNDSFVKPSFYTFPLRVTIK